MVRSLSERLTALIPPISIKVVSLCLLWYAVSSVSSQITKSILNEFPFPLALGEFQFVIVFFLSLITLLVLGHFRNLHSLFPKGTFPPLNGPSILRPSRHIIITVLPLGCFQFLGKLFSHSATALVPVSTVAAIKTLSPLVLVTTYRILYNVQFPSSTYLSLVPLIAGILLIVVVDTKETLVSTTTTHSQYIGILYASLSLVVFVAQNIYGKTVFTYNQKHINNHAELALANSASSASLSTLPLSKLDDHTEEAKELEAAKQSQHYQLELEKSKKLSASTSSFPQIRNQYDKLTLLLYCAALGALLSLPWFLYIEAHHFFLISSPSDIAEAQVVHIPWRLLFINGVSHYFQSLIAFHLLGAIPTLSYSIASMMKKITIIVVSMVYTGNPISLTQWVGLSMTTAGLYSYDRWGARKSATSSGTA